MNQYKLLTEDQRSELHSNFLIDSWSYSKLSTFARNEKAFEMVYIYGVYGKSSASQIAGQAYHKALEYYFSKKKEGEEIDIVDAEKSAFDYIEEIPANYWKLQKTTPSVEDCIIKATQLSSVLIKNFFSEKDVYETDVKQILDVEIYGEEFLTVNGVDIPLPCHFKIDVVCELNDGRIVIIDHKSKAFYSDESEMALVNGNQAITYVLGYESKTGRTVSEVWFVENKYSQNKDKSAQLRLFKITIDENSRKLFELQLYEPLRRMIQAVRDADYVYMINSSDNFVDRSEIYEFWARTMICEIDDFNVDPSKKILIEKRMKKIRDASVQMISPSIIKNFRENAASFIQYDLSSKDMTQEQKIEHVLRSFGTIVRVAHKFDGYSSSTYLVEVSAGIKVSSIQSHRLDIANALDVENVRIGKELMVYQGKSYLPIDFTKKREGILYFDKTEQKGSRVPLGKDNFDQTVFWDLENHSTPHMLICGATGSGKSVCVRSVIEYSRDVVDRIVIFDPKFEFVGLKGCEVYNDISDIEEQMKSLVDHMQDLVRNGGKQKTLVIFDEFADAVANSRSGKDLKIYENVLVGIYKNGMPKMKRECTGELKSLEENLRILLQKGRSSGFRVVAATQRASVKVITGDAKVNFPVQVCFRVPKETDSRVVLDEPGAESLAGMGDGLIKSPEFKDTVRFQAYYYDNTMIATRDNETKSIIVEPAL